LAEATPIHEGLNVFLDAQQNARHLLSQHQTKMFCTRTMTGTDDSQ